MKLYFNLNLFKTSHPFSAIIGTLTGVIIAIKFLDSTDSLIKLGTVFFLAQFLTGIVNDYIDFESDLQFQPLKITSRGGITQQEIKNAILINIIVLISTTLFLMPLDISIIVFLGTLTAQSYNIKFKDTPISGIVFVISFGLMASIPYILKYGYSPNNFPPRFIVSGLILAFIAHIINDLVDYEIDISRKSNSMTVFLGRSISLIIFSLLLSILMILQSNFIITISLIGLTILVMWGIKNPNYRVREFIYYTIAIISLVILSVIPVE